MLFSGSGSEYYFHKDVKLVNIGIDVTVLGKLVGLCKVQVRTCFFAPHGFSCAIKQGRLLFGIVRRAGSAVVLYRSLIDISH